MSELPASWTTVSLKDVGTAITGNTPPTSNPANYGHDVPFIKPPDLENRAIDSPQSYLSHEGAAISRTLPPLSVLVTCIGNLGRVGISRTRVAFNQQINAVVPSEAIDPFFFFYAAQSHAFRTQLESKASATTISIVNKGNFERITIPLPPLAEQKRIVAKIEELFSELEAGEESLRVARRQLGVYRQSLLKQAFEGKLTAKWRTQNPAKLESPDQLLSRIQSARQFRYEQQLKEWETNGRTGLKPRKLKLVDSLSEVEIASLPQVPDCWCWEKNERYLFEVKDGTHDTPQYVGKGIPFITQKHIQDGRIVFEDFKQISQLDHERFSERSNVEEGDLLISMIGKPGSCAIVRTAQPFSIKNVGLFKFFADLQSAAFLCYFYQSQGGLGYVMQFAKGGLQPFLGLKELRFWPVPVCSLPEQQEIVRLLDEQFEAVERNEREIDAALKRSEALRQSILHRAFTGQLVEQDPYDEPASELLARLRGERVATPVAERSRSKP